MPRYLTSQRIKNSIAALAETRAKAALMDFLILKRTLRLKGEPSVAITMGEPSYIQATIELAGIPLSGGVDTKAEKQIFNVFVASQEEKKGFRNGKYISNGTGTTIGGNPWQAVIELSTDAPRKASLRADHKDHVGALLLKSARTSKPGLGETALWNFRKTDVEAIIGGETDPAKRFKLIETRFVSDYGLTTDEITELFETTDGQVLDADLQTAPADPVDYLSGLSTTPVVAAVATSDKACLLDLVAALAAKPFVIVTGTSGVGKSRATLRLAEQIQGLYDDKVNGQVFQLVPIGPDWTSPKKLLGFRTPFGQLRKRADGTETNESYEITETVRVILRACHPSSTKIPHFLVFDEMNLSHVERYFAPFLSLMEASSILENSENAPIIDRQSLVVISELLDREDKDSSEAQSARLLVEHDQPLELPPNLFYVGTVNVDETTYMFSPKVLDRAHVLEVKALSPSQYVTGGYEGPIIDLANANQILCEAIDDRESSEAGSSDPSSILNLLATKHGVEAVELAKAKELTLMSLEGCFKLLSPTGFEFGFRVVKEVHGYMYVWIKAQLAIGKTPAEAMGTWTEGLDRAIFQKVLPKIHGNRSALGDSLKALAIFLDGGHAKSEPPAKYAIGADAEAQIEEADAIVVPPGTGFNLSKIKLRDMHARLVSRNYVSFVR